MDTHTTPMPVAEAALLVGANTSESPAINELAAALAKAQGAFSNPGRDRENPYFGSRYTTLGAVVMRSIWNSRSSRSWIISR